MAFVNGDGIRGGAVQEGGAESPRPRPSFTLGTSPQRLRPIAGSRLRRTPEHLFAAGYAACFGGALDFVGKQHKQDAAEAKITCAVSIGPREGGGFGISVKLRVEDKSLKQADLAALVQEAHEKICPYSHATRGNVDVQFEIMGG
jgi:Ohr subfamily peroxiredoxin